MSPEVIREALERYIAAVNSHNLFEAMSFLDENFRLEFVGLEKSVSKDDMKDIMGWDAGVSGNVTCAELKQAGRSLSGMFVERNDFFGLIGIESMCSHNTFDFGDDGLIISQRYKLLPGQPSVYEALEPAVKWARKNRAQELADIYPDDRISYREPMALRWVALLREWKAVS